MIHHQGAFPAQSVGIGVDVFVNAAGGEEIVEQEMLDAREQGAAVEQGEDFALVASHQVGVYGFFPVGTAEFHAVFFRKAFHLAVAEHGQAGEGGQHDAGSEIFITLAKLIHRGALIGVVHEVDEALEDFRLKFEGVLHDGAVLGVVFVAQQVHEGAVIHAVHAQGAHEIAFHQPERLGQQQGVGGFHGGTVHHLTPEFNRHEGIKLRAGEAVFGAGGDIAAGAGFGEPQALIMLLGQSHGGVEADDGELAGHVQNGLDDGFTHFGVEIV